MANGSVQQLSQPQNLADPVPQQIELPDIDQLLAGGGIEIGVPAPEEQVFEQQVQVNPELAEPELPDIDALLAAPEVPAETPEALNFAERFRLSFAGNAKEIVTDLNKRGFEAKIDPKDKDEVLFRRGKDQKFTRVDPEDFENISELINDVLADTGRLGFEAIIEAPIIAAGTVGGATAGSVVPGPGTIAGGAAGAVAAGAAGAAAATNAADLYAEFVLNIERDPERSRLNETLFAASFGGIAGKVGEVLGGWLKGAVARKVKTKELNEGGTRTVEQQLGDNITQFKADLDTLDDAGFEIIAKGQDGEPLRFTLEEIGGGNRTIKKALQPVIGDPVQEEVNLQLAESAGDALFSIAEETANVTRPGVPVKARELGAEVGDLISSALKREGELIGEFKGVAQKAFGKNPATRGQNFTQTKFTATETGFTMNDVLSELKFQRVGDEFVIPDLDTFLDALDVPPGTPQVGRFKKIVEKLTTKLFNNNGNLSPKDLDLEIKGLSDILSKPSVKRSPVFKKAVGRITSALRADRRTIVKAQLPEADQVRFDQAMNKFGGLKEATEEVSTLLDNSKRTQRAFMQSIFKKGGEGFGDFKIAKNIINEENPELWREMTGEFYDQIISEVTNNRAEPLNFQAFARKLNSFGPDFKKALVEDGPYDLKTLDAALRRADKAGKLVFGDLSEKEQNSIMKNLILSTSQFVSAKINSAIAIFKPVLRNKNLMKALSQRGIDDVLAEMPVAKAAKFKTWWNSFLRFSDETGRRGILEIQSVAGSGARAGLREEARDQENIPRRLEDAIEQEFFPGR